MYIIKIAEFVYGNYFHKKTDWHLLGDLIELFQNFLQKSKILNHWIKHGNGLCTTKFHS